jgi:16S rRNA (guanine966-N2)-methyltransferase
MKPKKGGGKIAASKSRYPSQNPTHTPTHTPNNGLIRIIGGLWRGRKLQVPAVPGLRPTPDRQRETLFNWLMPVIEGGYCLDLFAGSGALGLEAISRGAAKAVLVENHPLAVTTLRHSLSALHATQATLVEQDARQFLQRQPEKPFDIVFVDPPFALTLIPDICQSLSQPGWLNPEAMLYLEMPRQDAIAETVTLPRNGRIVRRHLSRETGAWLVQT